MNKNKINLQLFGAMKNKDLEIKNEKELQENMKNAIENADSEGFVKAQVEMAKAIEARILQEAEQTIANKEDTFDNEVMIKRGLNPLTKDEKEYYNEVIGSAGFGGVEKLMPATVFERVFEYLRTNHPLLNEIDFVNTTGVTEWVTRNGDAEAAWWGQLCEAIKKKLEVAFKKEKTELYKLSAYVPVCKAMLDLGPQWLDKFVRELLAESMAIALELAIVDGTGNGQPIGMMRDLAGGTYGASDSEVTGGTAKEGDYKPKATVALNDLQPATLGTKIMSPLTKDGKRAVNNVLLLVNPLDYWEKIFAQTTYLTADKTYVYGVLPIPAKVIQSVAVERGKMVAGLAKDYFMGVGSTQKIDFSDHYKWLDDERTYIAKQYANGKPVDNESFIVFDISGMNPPQA
ncbi:phage major capsid protein [Senegalia massiliensis]|uniref:phage major capsid protein n=1 Tax=Senegalia massiliensis TaxID=1720316 RepID=UPI001F5F656C|nr:phage major capsid protein [Senegalia massiliensis]